MLTRRKFLVTAACTVAAARLHAQGHSNVRVALAIPSEATGPHMPIDFVGLSYEIQQLADPDFLFGAEQRPDSRVQSTFVNWRSAPWRQHQRVRILETYA